MTNDGFLNTFVVLFVFGLHLFDFHSITMPPHCAFVQAKHLLAQKSKITTKEFIEIPAKKIDPEHSRSICV